ncbi:hypothetical protein BDV27DRAFT_100595 [Aspergillus caelatus]|uniref:Uncharacterized protein n=1 Tax=Aspergillus caelatus TaxID=61420 RepID=A0A5N7AAW2_9EURO|nr:uncharacterized protein BDV27DRAFT_100595 [Aspergillus caelatus]KAE8365720.1 hypothetical protein BDV27DRAFT_100595 [Aspergillus caelatus]
MPDGLVRINLPVTRHWRPLYEIGIRDNKAPQLSHLLFKGFGDLMCLIITAGITMGFERSCHLVETVIGRFPAISLELGNCLDGNILRLTHNIFKIVLLIPIFENSRIAYEPLEANPVKLSAHELEIRTLADLRPVDRFKIRVLEKLDRPDDFTICVALRLFLDYADFLHEGLQVTDNASLGASGRHARAGEAVGLDF